MFEWDMAKFVVKDGHHNDTCYNEIGLGMCNQFGVSYQTQILGSVVDMIGEA